MGRIDTILQGGFAGYRQFVNPMVALRGQLLGEPWQAVRAAAGQLVDGDRPVEDFHGTQSFGHRNRHVTEAVREFLDTDAVNWYPARMSPFAGSLAERLCEIRGDGMILGLALRPIEHPWLSFEHLGVEGLAGQPSVGVLLCFRLHRRGYYCFVCGHRWGVLRVQPRFDIEESALAGFVRAVREELDYLCSQS